ncbi:MAG: sugar phosphate nucleotidyltransferase, partial [Gemmatimonadaceae bacterium]
MTRWAVILAGGVGSRFWPVSTPARPKQLLPLAT